MRFLNSLIGELENGLEWKVKNNFIRKKNRSRQSENLSRCLDEDGGEKAKAVLLNLESDTMADSHRTEKRV